MFKRKKLVITVLAVLVALGLLGTAAVFGINAYVKHVGGGYIISEEEACEMKDVDCIIVLGCQVRRTSPQAICLKTVLTMRLCFMKEKLPKNFS